MAEGMTHERVDGILKFRFNRPQEKVNTLDADILREIDGMLDEARGRGDIRAVMFISDKPAMFIAGMDIEQIGSVKDPHEGAEGARMGQAVFQKIEDLGKPSVAAIGGTCLGGGLELSLACTFRIAADEPSLRIGLPEVQLGIIPGFGGTQRFPRTAGLMAALDMVLAGKAVNAKKGRRVGLVDLVCPAAYLEREAVQLLERAIERGEDKVAASLRKSRGRVAWMMESVGPIRGYVMGQARKKVAAKANPEHYPAPFKALEAIEASYTKTGLEGYDLEARLIGELIPTRTCRSLMWLFKSQNALKGDNAVNALPRKVRRVGVLGAGVMGGGIAQLVADKELPVRLKDLNYDAVLTALQTAGKVWNKQFKKKRLTRGGLARKVAQIAPTLDYSGFRHVDLIIEAVVENLEIKQAVLDQVEAHVGERTVFASNTSSIPISDIAARARHPERVVGMHFFNPVHRMPLIEVIAGRRSSPEAVATVHKLAVQLGKVPVVVKDSPGFLVNRILTLYLFEAMLLLRDGVRMEALDRAMVAFGMPMGPFALMDQVGLDTAKHVGEVLQAAFGKRIGADDPVLPAMVADGRLGQKNGKGFYRFQGDKSTEPDATVYKLIGDPAPRDLPPETLEERMILTMINEAALCLEESVAASARDVDMAMVMGTGFPPFRGGLLHHADEVGIPVVVDRLSRLADAHGPRFRPAGLLQEMVREQRRFYV